MLTRTPTLIFGNLRGSDLLILLLFLPLGKDPDVDVALTAVNQDTETLRPHAATENTAMKRTLEPSRRAKQIAAG
jgi:hypothetical protein